MTCGLPKIGSGSPFHYSTLNTMCRSLSCCDPEHCSYIVLLFVLHASNILGRLVALYNDIFRFPAGTSWKDDMERHWLKSTWTLSPTFYLRVVPSGRDLAPRVPTSPKNQPWVNGFGGHPLWNDIGSFEKGSTRVSFFSPLKRDETSQAHAKKRLERRRQRQQAQRRVLSVKRCEE